MNATAWSYLGTNSGKLQKKRIALLLSNISHRSNYKRIKLSQTSAGPCKASQAINWTGQVEESTYHYKILSQKVNIMFQEIKNIKENMILSAQVWASLTLVFLKIFIHIRVKNLLKKKMIQKMMIWWCQMYLQITKMKGIIHCLF